MGIAIVFFLGCDVINFEFTLNFLIRPFFKKKKKSKKKIKLKLKKNIKKKKKKKKNCLRSENAPLIHSGQGLCKNIHSICKVSVRVND